MTNDVSKTHEVEQTVEHEWNATMHTDGSMDIDPCPYCGETNVFGAYWSAGGQMVKPGLNRADEDIGDFVWDDWWAEDLERVTCHNCYSVLYSVDDEYPDDQPVEEPNVDHSTHPRYDTEWRVVRRSTPPEYIAGLDDDAVEYYVETTDDLALTIYAEDDDKYVLVGTIENDEHVIDRSESFDELKEILEFQKRTLAFAR